MEAGTVPVLVHNCDEVEYGSTRLSQAVQKARLADNNKDNNYAAALLRHPETGEDMGVVAARSVGKIHAEQNIINSLKNGALPGVDESYISEVYSEFQPCASRCSKLLGKLPNLKQTTWSWAWDKSGTEVADASTAARNAAVKALFEGK